MLDRIAIFQSFFFNVHCRFHTSILNLVSRDSSPMPHFAEPLAKTSASGKAQPALLRNLKENAYVLHFAAGS